ncbi:hypothetical protein [uncultured Sphingomonas sp.]|uniref:hypothetical protein n=1 Tax=uncultured Sphingomonas sp. TaxID=158754 RepID=UPI0025FBEBF4|nr:hypothetical protein [uncultured Sphingomonas sp.]
MKPSFVGMLGVCTLLAAPGMTQGAAPPPADLAALRTEIARERQALEQQQRALTAQHLRLESLERALLARMGPGQQRTQTAGNTPTGVPLPPSPPPASPGASAPVQTVGEAPTDQRQVQVAVLADQGGVITRRGLMTIEGDLEYARADRNRVLFRGVSIPEAVLIGAFDINESRQDVVTAAAVMRLGLTSRFEINGRVPFVRRSDNSALAPVVDNGDGSNVGTDRTVTDSNLGDVDFGARYQITDGQNGFPYLITGVQAVAPTGTDPFAVPRDTLGNPLRAATGAGFWGVTPNLTAILPTDPAVLFGTLGYTFNFGRNIERRIGSAIVERVTPGGQPAASVGIAISLNPRTSLSLGYAHTLALGTKTRLRTIDPRNGAESDAMTVRTRDLQLGRLLFGVSYRTSPRTTINWNLELGATDDATDMRTTLRVPLNFQLF